MQENGFIITWQQFVDIEYWFDLLFYWAEGNNFDSNLEISITNFDVDLVQGHDMSTVE